MNTRRNIKAVLTLFVLLFAFLAVYLIYVLNEYGMSWFSSAYNTRVTAEKSNVVAGNIVSSDGIVLAATNDDGERKYCEDMNTRLALSHIVGDNYGQTTGAESRFAKYLLGFDQDFFDRIEIAVSGEKRYGSNITLTLNADICAFAHAQLGENDGAIVLMNYKTGEIVASVSSPAFDNALADEFVAGEVNFEDGDLVNRVNMGRYTPGSTFKIVTLIAALRYIPNVENRVFHCDGPLVFDKSTGKLLNYTISKDDEETAKGYALLRDFEDEYHGELTLKSAFSHSCNHVFAELAMEIGSARLKQVASELMLNGEFVFNDIMAYTGSYESANTDFELAWSGVGQHKDIMTPLHMCMLSAAVANGGVVMEPRILQNVTSRSGGITYVPRQEKYKTILQGNEAALLKEYMRETIVNGTGKKAAVEGFDVCGKTGTAEVSSNDAIQPHAWFTGFIDNESCPLAICVVVENGGGGGKVAAPIASAVFEYATRKLG